MLEKTGLIRDVVRIVNRGSGNVRFCPFSAFPYKLDCNAITPKFEIQPRYKTSWLFPFLFICFVVSIQILNLASGNLTNSFDIALTFFLHSCARDWLAIFCVWSVLW